MTRASKMYKDGPTVKKDEESGRPKVGKREEEADKVQEGMEGVKTEEKNGPHEHARRAMHHRHMHEHMQMHHMHEIEHSMHEGDKSEMHTKHEKEYAAMHERHHGEMKAMHASHEKHKGEESGEKMIEKSKEKPINKE